MFLRVPGMQQERIAVREIKRPFRLGAVLSKYSPPPARRELQGGLLLLAPPLYVAVAAP